MTEIVMLPPLHDAFEAYYATLLEESRVGLSDVLRREVWGVIAAQYLGTAGGQALPALVMGAVDAELRRRGALLEG